MAKASAAMQAGALFRELARERRKPLEMRTGLLLRCTDRRQAKLHALGKIALEHSQLAVDGRADLCLVVYNR